MTRSFVGDLLSGFASLLLACLVALLRQTNKSLRNMAAERHWIRDTARWTIKAVPTIAAKAGATIDPPPAEPGTQTATVR